MSTEIAGKTGPRTSKSGRTHQPIDSVILRMDSWLRSISAESSATTTAYPAEDLPENEISEADRAASAAMMRVNHAGEVCAQALYHGQALTARSSETADHLLEAAAEETEHLRWCEQRLDELGAPVSALNPLWYAGSFVTGAAAGVFGDRVSLGFVRETERQVEAHLQSHLDALPASDERSRAICARMQADEIRHGDEAARAGGVELPSPIRAAMRVQAKIMTTLAARI